MGRRELQDVWERFVGPGVGTAVLQVASSRFGEESGGAGNLWDLCLHLHFFSVGRGMDKRTGGLHTAPAFFFLLLMLSFSMSHLIEMPLWLGGAACSVE